MTWCEYYGGGATQSLTCALKVTGATMKAGAKSGYAVQSVGVIDEFLGLHDRKVRFVHEETEDNPAHSLIRRWPEADTSLLDAIATGIDWDVHLHRDLAEVLEPCEVSERGAA